MTNKVFCIIVTYNAMKWVDKCLGSLRNSEVLVSPVVVDNLSKDNTVQYIRTNYPEAHIIENKTNRGFGQANNQGIEWAYGQGAKHFFLLNQDAWILPNTISELISVQNQYGFALVSPIHLNGSGDRMDFGFYRSAVEGNHSIQMVSDVLLNKKKPYYVVESEINAAAWMMSRNLIENVGGFDPVFFHYGEDTHYIQRMKYHKQIMVVAPSAFVHHDRLYHGNEDAYKKGATLRALLLRGANINHSLIFINKDVLVGDLLILGAFVKSLFGLQFSNCISIIVDVAKYWLNIKRIYKSRRINKTKGPHWLVISKL